MNTLIVLSALLSVVIAIPSYGYGDYSLDEGHGGILLSADLGKGSEYSTSYTTTKILTPIITKKSYEEPIRETEFHRTTKITPIYKKVIIAKPVITKTITPIITKSYEISEPQIISTHGGYGGGYGDEDLSYGSDVKIISYGKGY